MKYEKEWKGDFDNQKLEWSHLNFGIKLQLINWKWYKQRAQFSSMIKYNTGKLKKKKDDECSRRNNQPLNSYSLSLFFLFFFFGE